MCIPYIYCWNNGAGNQLLTMLNILYYSFYFKKFKGIKFPTNQYFTPKTLTNEEISDENLTCACDNEHDITRRINPCSDWFCTGISVLKNLFEKHVTYNFSSDITHSENDIGIHIRSGDIFGGNVHWEYVQPPLDYYIQIMNKNPDKSIIIVHDTNPRKPYWRNPVLDKIIEHIDTNNLHNVKIQSKSIREDISALASCKTIFCAMGTFSLMCYIISPIAKQIYIPHYMHNKKRGKNWFVLDDSDKNVVKEIEIKDYIRVGSWKNTPEQQELMLNYKMNPVEIEKLSINI